MKKVDLETCYEIGDKFLEMKKLIKEIKLKISLLPDNKRGIEELNARMRIEIDFNLDFIIKKHSNIVKIRNSKQS